MVLLDDDPECVHECRAELDDAGFRVEAHETAASVLRARYSGVPAAFIVDLELPGESGIDTIGELHRRHPDVPIVALTSHVAEAYVFGALRAGAVGYLLKHDGARRVPPAVREAIGGGAPMTSSIARRVLLSLRADPPEPPSSGLRGDVDDASLTGREVDVLSALSRGLTYDDCARVLGVSIDTVRTHVRNVYAKLHASSKAEAVSLAMRRGWIQ